MAWTAPKTVAQLQENLQVLSNYQLNQTEKSLWQSYEDLVYGDGQDSFDTQWA